MDRIENLEQDVKKYLCSRKVFRIIEMLTSVILVVVLIALDNELLNIIACIGGVIIISELFLGIQRWEIKDSIKNEDMLAKKDLEFYSEMKGECEKIRNEFISKGSEKFVSDECKELVWKEEMGIGWLSLKMKNFESKCKEVKQIIEELKSIKRLVIF